MKILFAGSEMDPLARTGGLGDVLEALPAALAARGHEVSVVMPCYRGLREQARDTGVKIAVQIGGRRLPAEIWECTAAVRKPSSVSASPIPCAAAIAPTATG